jgi:hypothetical protein
MNMMCFLFYSRCAFVIAPLYGTMYMVRFDLEFHLAILVAIPSFVLRRMLVPSYYLFSRNSISWKYLECKYHCTVYFKFELFDAHLFNFHKWTVITLIYTKVLPKVFQFSVLKMKRVWKICDKLLSLTICSDDSPFFCLLLACIGSSDSSFVSYIHRFYNQYR